LGAPERGPSLPAGRAASPARRRAVSILSEFFGGGRRPLRLARDLAGLGDADRDLARELVLGVLRRRTALDAEIGRFSRFALDRLKPPVREILETALFQIRFLERVPTRAAVHEAVAMARAQAGEGASRLVNGVLRSALREPPRPLPRASPRELAEAFSHPVFLVERWAARFGIDRTRAILAADDERGRMHLLCDVRRFPREEVARRLRAEGVETAPLAAAENGLEVVSGNPLRSAAFAEGAFYVADAGSQALPFLLPPGGALLDLAAAPGGKTASALFSGRFARSFAADVSLDRLGVLRENRGRIDLAAAHPVAADVLAPPFPAGGFGRVLLDAPCSGTGTLRKSPEIRYRVTPAVIEAMAAAELRLLVSAAALVAPGGYLLYSTCSLEEEENERVAAGLVAADPSMRPAPIDPPDALRSYVSGAVFRLYPDGGTDGFTAHLFRRSPDR
jgi:16S rRNA (cytosine967-C5)-methyltransferase